MSAEPGLPGRQGEPDVLEAWTCLSCGVIGDRQSCFVCGAECQPGSWVPLERVGEVLRQIDAAWHRYLDMALRGGMSVDTRRSELIATRQRIQQEFGWDHAWPASEGERA